MINEKKRINNMNEPGTYTTSARSSMIMRPAGAPPIVMSKNTFGLPILAKGGVLNNKSGEGAEKGEWINKRNGGGDVGGNNSRVQVGAAEAHFLSARGPRSRRPRQWHPHQNIHTGRAALLCMQPR